MIQELTVDIYNSLKENNVNDTHMVTQQIMYVLKKHFPSIFQDIYFDDVDIGCPFSKEIYDYISNGYDCGQIKNI